MRFFHYRLSNGIRLIHKKTERSIAHCGLILKSGARDELQHEQGLAHFIEHVIFKGTKKRKAYHILSRMEDVGGEINAFTSKEETCIYSTFLPKFYDRALELISDITFHSNFPKKELEKEKSVILDEINYYKDTPSELIFDEFEEQVFKDHPLGNNILGTPKHILSFDKDMIESFIQRNFLSQEMVISSVGNICENKLVNIVEKYFGSIPKNSNQKSLNPFKNYHRKEVIVPRSGFQSHCLIGRDAFGINHPKKTALILLNNILGGPGMNSRLNLGVREKYGFTYSIESNYTPYSDTGIFSIYLASDKKDLERSIGLTKKELAKLMHVPLGQKQLKKAKRQLIGQLAISQENDINLMLSMGKSVLFYNEVNTFEQVEEKIDSISSQDLMDVAKEIFNEDELSYLIYKI